MTEHWDGGDRTDEDTSWTALLTRVREVAAACSHGDLARLRVSDGATKIDVRRSPVPPAVTPAAAAPAADLPLPAANGQPPAPAVDELVADVVGVFRSARPPVEVGSAVPSGRELGAVESLGIRNPVVVRSPGTVSAVYVADGQPVDYGRPLFAIER